MRLTVSFLIFAFAPLALSAQSALRSAKAAQALLGPATWSRVVRVENKNAHSVYPRDEYALIFEFAGILWFYSEADGTQSFSLFSNRLAQEKADFGPGLRAIEPGFGAYSVISDKPDVALRTNRVPNGCLIESIVAARDRFARGERITAAKLVMFYAVQRREGHCVLAYETAEGIFTLDADHSAIPHFFGHRWPANAVELALAAWPGGKAKQISQVRTLSCPIMTRMDDGAAAWAAASSGADAAGGEALPDPGRG